MVRALLRVGRFFACRYCASRCLCTRTTVVRLCHHHRPWQCHQCPVAKDTRLNIGPASTPNHDSSNVDFSSPESLFNILNRIDPLVHNGHVFTLVERAGTL